MSTKSYICTRKAKNVWKNFQALGHDCLYYYSIRTVPIMVLSVLSNSLQYLFSSVFQRLIQKPFAGGSSQAASLPWGSERACKAVGLCQLILMLENIPGHMYSLYLYQCSCVWGVSGSYLQLIKLLGLGAERNFSHGCICLCVLLQKGSRFILKYHMPIYFF